MQIRLSLSPAKSFQSNTSGCQTAAQSAALSPAMPDQVLFSGRKKKADAVKEAAPAETPVLSETNKLIYQLALESFNKALTWQHTSAEIDGTHVGMDEGETFGVNAIQTKLKDGRTVLLGGSFLDISNGEGCVIGIKEKGSKKLETRVMPSEQVDDAVLELFNEAYMLRYSWLEHVPDDEDLERWSELLAKVDPGYKV